MEQGIGPVRWRVGEQAVVLQPPGKLGERDLGLQPGQRRAEAIVDAGAEAQVLAFLGTDIRAFGVVPVRIEPVRVAHIVGVPVAGGKGHADRGASRNRYPGDIDVVKRQLVRQEVNGWLVAE